MTPEEKAEMEAAGQEAQSDSKAEPTTASVSAATANATVPPASTPGTSATVPGADDVSGSTPVMATGTTSATDAHGASSTSAAEDSLRSLSLHGGEARPEASASASSSSDHLAKQKEKEKAKGKAKLTPEQKAKLDEIEKKQDEEKEKRSVFAFPSCYCILSIPESSRTDMPRITELQAKLVARIRPFVDAKNPGDVNDHETKVFEARIKTEAEDLKLESFGIEVCRRFEPSSWKGRH